jgi:hypothetical protein
MRCAWSLLAGVLLAGCGGDPVEALYADYLARLERATGVAAPANALASQTLRYPRGRERHLPVPEVTGGILELFRLGRCDVDQLIAERNSILGRHADAATHLAIGGRIAQRLRRCNDELAGAGEENVQLQARIEALLRQKSEQLSALAWNASLGSRAMADWWSPSADPLAPADAAMPGDGLEQLVLAVTAAESGERDQASRAFSAAYRQLEQQRYGGAWIGAAQASVAGLAAAEAMLAEIDTRRLCPQRRPTPKSRVLRAILQQRYVEAIQPMLAELERSAQRMRDQLEILWRTSGDPPAAVGRFRARVWAEGESSLSGRLVQRSRFHAAAWKRLLDACGFPPGRALGG